MDVTLQRHCARYIYVVPDGLRELLSDISREVLRCQPVDIYTFIADYLDALLITRENARIAAKFVQDMTEASETVVHLLKKTGMTRKEADKTAAIIQKSFRTWSDRRGILKDDDETVVARIIEEVGLTEAQAQTGALVIQTAFKMFKQRQARESKLLSGIIDWRVAARSAIKLYRRCGVSPEEARRAANLIKAAYKGYYTRKAMWQLTEELDSEEEPEEMSSEESTSSEEPKIKGVRIDYQSVVPHVDFADDEFIVREGFQEPVEESRIPRKSDEEYIADILLEILENIIGPDEEVQLPIIEEQDSVLDDFIPTFVTAEQPLYNRAPPLPILTEEELETELQAVKDEAHELQQTPQLQGLTDESKSRLKKVHRPHKEESLGLMETREVQVSTEPPVIPSTQEAQIDTEDEKGADSFVEEKMKHGSLDEDAQDVNDSVKENNVSVKEVTEEVPSVEGETITVEAIKEDVSPEELTASPASDNELVGPPDSDELAGVTEQEEQNEVPAPEETDV